MKVGVPGVDRLDAVLAHQYRCLCIVHQVAANRKKKIGRPHASSPLCPEPLSSF